MHAVGSVALEKLWSQIKSLVGIEVEASLTEAKESGEFDGDPGIYYGTEEPTSESHPVWIDPSGGESFIPTKVSELENDAGYLTQHQDISGKLDKSALLNLVYPVGSIYMSVNSTSPQTFIGGTWERLQDRFLLGAGSTYSAGATGGAATHTLTVDEMPSHSHTAKGWAAVVDGSGKYITLGGDGSSNTYSTRATGGGEAHNNMPPYLAVYMWKRTA